MKLLDELKSGKRPFVWFQKDQGVCESAPQTCGALLSGSFNPLHVGHLQIIDVAKQLLNTTVGFELSVTNVDKPALDEATIIARCNQFLNTTGVLTCAPTFVEKAARLPGKVFVVGADTAVRIVDPKYYDNDSSAMLRAMDAIRWNGCRFLVAGRTMDGTFATVAHCEIPESVADLFEQIPEDMFRADVSSTEIRENGSGDSPHANG